MTPVSARVTAWVEEIGELLPEARRGFMEDRAPEAAGFLIDAAPALLAVVRGVAGLAEELVGWRDNAERYSNAVDVGSAVYERSMGRARAYERAIEGLTRLLADAAPDTEKETDR